MHTITFDLSLSLLLLLLVTNIDNMRGYQARATVRANSVRRDTSHGVYYVEIVSCACVYHVMRSEEAICYEMCGTRRRFSVARRLVAIEVLLSDKLLINTNMLPMYLTHSRSNTRPHSAGELVSLSNLQRTCRRPQA